MRVRAWLLLLALPFLQGCLTAHMWDTYEPASATAAPVLLASEQREQQGSVLAARGAADDGMLWVGDGGGEAWRLRPDRGGDFLEALLRDEVFCEVARADVDAERSYVDYSVRRDAATVDLQLDVRGSNIVRERDERGLTPGARRVLATERRNAFLLAADPTVRLSPLCRQCVQRLSAIDFGALFGDPGRWHAQSYVFVDERGVPDGEPPVPGHDTVFGSVPGDPTLTRKLQTLRQRSLLLKLRRGGETRVLELRADRAWLLAGLEPVGQRGGMVHRSTWHLEPVVLADALPASGDAVMLPSTLALRERQYTQDTSFSIDGGLIRRILLTPITVAADLAFGPQIVEFLRWLFGDGPALPPRRGPGTRDR